MNIEDVGLTMAKYPITQVKCHFQENKWHVQYRKPAKGIFGFILKYHWFHDSKYNNYIDARARAEFLASSGYYEVLEHIEHTYFTRHMIEENKV